MMDVNDYQIGGKHYQMNYQHWDFVPDVDLHYLLGCATKYVARWRSKNGIEDLRKASHYLAKAEDRDIFPVMSASNSVQWTKFWSQLPVLEKSILGNIYNGDYMNAQSIISDVILDLENGATANYIDPDKNYIRG